MSHLSENELTTFSKFSITSADTDMYSRISAGSLVNFLIQSAIDSADRLGFGFGELRDQKLFWVLSRLTLDISRPLVWKEKIEVETWPKDVNKLLYLRDFIVRDCKGQEAARATSGWLAVDIESKRIKKIEGVDSGYFIKLKKKHAITEPPEKIGTVEGNGKYLVTSGYSDIDLNKHVTATSYIDWVMDTFSPEFHGNNYPVQFSVNLMKETMINETIRILKKADKKGTYCFEGINTDRNSTAFRASVRF